MAIQTIQDKGEQYLVTSNVDGATYRLMGQDCICEGMGDEFTINYSEASLDVTFAKNSQAVICGNALWLTDSETVTLTANSTIYLCLRINPQNPYGKTGSIVQLTEAQISNGNVNAGETCDLLLYIVTTGTNGVTSVVDKRNIIGSNNGNIFDITDVTITASSFVADTTYADYPYKATYANSKITSNTCCDVIFTVDSLALVSFAPVNNSIDGGLEIYADSVPASDVSIARITCRKANVL